MDDGDEEEDEDDEVQAGMEDSEAEAQQNDDEEEGDNETREEMAQVSQQQVSKTATLLDYTSIKLRKSRMVYRQANSPRRGK